MNKAELKKFAVEARHDLADKVSLKAGQYGIAKNKEELKIEEKYGQLFVNGKSYPTEMKKSFRTLQQRLNAVGYKQLIEEVSYTWFNRIIAIRYMEVNNYLPNKVNVLSSSTGKNEPDILSQYETMNLNIDHLHLKELIKKGNNEQAYRELFIAQCNMFNENLPLLFEKINDYTELLLPDYLMDSEFIVSKLVNNQALTESFEEVEVIGWLYQYYSTEAKDEVFAKLRNNTKISKYDIPAATQLFTPRWIVQYMVENSLGKLWLEANPKSDIVNNMKYYIDPSEQGENVAKVMRGIKYSKVDLEEVKIIDPCVGSGHILAYAFDLLYQMYEESGYPKSQIPQLILEKNLFGVDIDHRAVQLASFTLIMKARQKSRRVFRGQLYINVAVTQETNSLDQESVVNYLATNEIEKDELFAIFEAFLDAKMLGSMIKPPNVEVDKYIKRIEQLDSKQLTFDDYEIITQLEFVKLILNQNKLLSSTYDIAITNPPYMGAKGMNQTIKKYVQKHYKNEKGDLFAVFINRLANMTKSEGFHSLITMHSWMFLSTFKNLRTKYLNENTILSMVHLGSRAFEDVGGEVVQTTSFVSRSRRIKNFRSTFIRLNDFRSPKEKEKQFLNLSNRFVKDQGKFNMIPNSSFAYWLTDDMLNNFEHESVDTYADSKKGLDTADNARFVRRWFEVSDNKVYFPLSSVSKHSYKWFPLNKGGSYRKWYGNNLDVINWENAGEELKNFSKSNIRNESYYFKENITWTVVSTNKTGFRYSPKGYIFSNSGNALFSNNENDLYYLAGLLNSIVGTELLNILSPSMGFESGYIAKVPVINSDSQRIIQYVKENIQILKEDWDSFEISWDFRKHPFTIFKEKIIANSYQEWEEITNERFMKVKKNEEGINQYFLDLYNLSNEYNHRIQDNEVKISTANRKKDTKSFLSYFVGCIMGRYSLDVDGVSFAGSEFDESKYKTFTPNQDGLLQLTDDYYFENDIIGRLREFLSVAFSPDTVVENMQWLAESLTMKKSETPEDRLRRYFLDEFFEEHCKTYQKRPIYWLVNSGTQKGLRTLIYMHRYQPDTMATIRFEHLQEIQSKYQNEIDMIDTRLANPSLSATDRRSLEKAKTDYQKKIDELQEFDKQLATYANEQIDIDLDDGVKVNYAKFDNVLAKIK